MPRYVAASDESALRFERLQTELGEGPCIAAYETGEAVAVPDLREDSRFPTFAPRALAAGLVAVFTFPLRQGDHRLGALDLYRDDRRAAGRAEPWRRRRPWPTSTAAYLLNAQARADLQDSSDRFQGALAARRADRAPEPDPAGPAPRARRSCAAAGRGRRWRSSSPTSTGSRRSTTPTGTTSATSCSSRWRTGSPACCGPATPLPGCPGTSSSSCARTSTTPSQVEPIAARHRRRAGRGRSRSPPVDGARHGERRHRVRRPRRRACRSRCSTTPTPPCTRPSAAAAAGTQVIDLRRADHCDQPERPAAATCRGRQARASCTPSTSRSWRRPTAGSIGVEALLRWAHPDLGVVGAGDGRSRWPSRPG